MVAVALVAGGIVGVLRALPPEPRVPVNQPAKWGWPSVDLRQVVLDESATPLQARFQARDRGEGALEAGLPPEGLPADDTNARMTTGFVQAERTVFERVGEPPLHDASLETWLPSTTPRERRGSRWGSSSTACTTTRIDPTEAGRAAGRRRGQPLRRPSDPRNVIYLWRHENLLLCVTTEGNFRPRTFDASPWRWMHWRSPLADTALASVSSSWPGAE